VPAAGEPVDVGHVTDQPGRSGRADAVQVLQAAAGRLDEFAELFVSGFRLLVDLDEFGDQLGGKPAASPADQITRTDGIEQRAGLLGRYVLLGAPGSNSSSSLWIRLSRSV
jgi:hypothetical protein